MKHKLISAMLCMTLATSCVDMDIAPKKYRDFRVVAFQRIGYGHLHGASI